MDVRYINPFINSVTNVLVAMCGLKVTVGMILSDKKTVSVKATEAIGANT